MAGLIKRKVSQTAERSIDFKDSVHVRLVWTRLGLNVMPVLWKHSLSLCIFVKIDQDRARL